MGNNGRILVNKMTIKIGKAKEGLKFFQIARNRPVTDDTTFRRVHRNARGRNDETKVFHRIGVERALLGFGVKVVLAETL